jgi:type IV pilus assembly protein PilQ
LGRRLKKGKGIKMKNSAKDFIFGDGNTMNHMFRQFSMGAIAMAVMQVASAQVSITNIVPMQIPGQGTEIRVMFNGLPPQPQAYQLEQPSRLVLDFDKAQQSLKQGSIAVATAEASTVDVTSDAQRSRLTVNLADAGAFTTRVEGNTFILKINSANPALATPVAAARSEQGISNIGFIFLRFDQFSYRCNPNHITIASLIQVLGFHNNIKRLIPRNIFKA